MTIDRFQSIVRILSNQVFVRWYCCVNYGFEPPQVLGIQFPEGYHGFTVSKELRKTLTESGFHLDDRWPGIWVVERTEE